MKTYTAASSVVRTPEQLAKNAMKQAALAELSNAGLAQNAIVTVEYMGCTHTLDARPTVNVKNGQILFHFGAVGVNRLPIELEGGNISQLSFGVGGNIMTGLQIDEWNVIRSKYGLSATPDSDLEAGETTE